MADIKTRDAVKGTIKSIDKAAVAGQRMKQTYLLISIPPVKFLERAYILR